MEENKEEKEKPSEIPFISFGNDEFIGKNIKKGDYVICKNCDGLHEILAAETIKNGKYIESNKLLFYKCNNNLYLCSVKGKALPGIEFRSIK